MEDMADYYLGVILVSGRFFVCQAEVRCDALPDVAEWSKGQRLALSPVLEER